MYKLISNYIYIEKKTQNKTNKQTNKQKPFHNGNDNKNVIISKWIEVDWVILKTLFILEQSSSVHTRDALNWLTI